MTHLEIYLETLRDLPLVAARQAAWLHTLDTKGNALQRDCDVAQEEILTLCKSGSSPTPEQLQKLRAKQWEAYAMCQEKMALAAEWSKILESYSIRLSEEMEAYEQELPPELLRQTLDGGASGKKPTTSDVKKKGKVSEKEIELLPATTSGTAAATLGNLTGNAAAVTPLPSSTSSSSSSTTSSTTTPAISAVGGTNKIRIKNPVKLQPSSSSGNLKAKSTKQKLEDEALGLTHDISGADEPESDDLLITSTTPAVSVPTSTPLVDQAVYSTEEDYPPTKISGPPALKHKNPDGSAGVGVPSDEVFCTCRQVSFGEMIGCDDPKCRIEWFHFACVGLTQKPKSGSWYCDECKARNAKA